MHLTLVIIGYKVRPCEREKGERQARLVRREGGSGSKGVGQEHTCRTVNTEEHQDFAMLVFLASSD